MSGRRRDTSPPHREPLSPREREIAEAYSDGESYREIAERLGIAPSTVRTHLTTIYRKLGVSTKIALARALTIHDSSVQSRQGGARLLLPRQPSIAVMPFVTIGEQDILAQGLTEDITSRLTFVRGLIVRSRPSAVPGGEEGADDAARRLDVHYILEGSIRTAGDRLRVVVKLFDADAGATIWSERFDRQMRDIFAIQDEIAQAVVLAMQVELVDGDVLRTEPGATRNIDAWERFHRGLRAVLTYSPESGARARALYDQALEHDPDFSDARVYRAWTYWQDSRSGFTDDRAGFLGECRRQLDALKADGVATANALHLEGATLLLERRHAEALSIAARAVAKGPCKVFGFTPASLVYLYSGKVDEALSLLKTTVRVYPYTPNDAVYTLAMALCIAGDHADAVRIAEEYMRRVPTDLYAYTLLALTYGLAGETGMARTTIGRFRESYPDYHLSDYSAHEPFSDLRVLDTMMAALKDAGLPA